MPNVSLWALGPFRPFHLMSYFASSDGVHLHHFKWCLWKLLIVTGLGENMPYVLAVNGSGCYPGTWGWRGGFTNIFSNLWLSPGYRILEAKPKDRKCWRFTQGSEGDRGKVKWGTWLPHSAEVMSTRTPGYMHIGICTPSWHNGLFYLGLGFCRHIYDIHFDFCPLDTEDFPFFCTVISISCAIQEDSVWGWRYGDCCIPSHVYISTHSDYWRD
jgi:hypothetical protein